MPELRKKGINVLKKLQGVFIFALSLVSHGTVAQTAVDTQRTVRVVMDNNYAPYVFQSDEGKLQGILIDQWQAWEKMTGIKVDIHAMDWSEALRSMRAGEFDVIDCIVETADRQDYFDFTPAYNKVGASIYFRKEISGISDIASLKGFAIGDKTGDQHIDKLKASGVTNMILFHNNDAIIEASKKHAINVFLMDDPSALYLLNKMGIESEFRHTAPIFRDELRRAVRKGDTATLNMVSEGFAAIEPDKLKQIDEKWFGRTINTSGRYLRYLTYAFYAVAVAILLIAGLAFWNRTLRKQILKRTEALRQSEDRIRLIIDTIPSMAWSLTPDGIVDFLNQRWMDYTGLSLKQYIKDPTGPIHPEDIPGVIEKWLINKAAEKAYDDEMRLRRADGEYRWFLVRTAPLHDEQGKLVKWYGVSIDIEDSKRAENALRESEQRYLALFENMTEAVAYFQMMFKDGKLQDAIYLEVNPAWEKLTGLKNVVGRKLTEILPGVLETNSEFIVRSARVALTSKPERFEAYSTQLKKWLSTSAYCPKKEHVIVVFEDISERKMTEEALRKSEDHLRLVTDTIPALVISALPDGSIDFINQTYQQFTGLSLNDVAGWRWTSVIHPDDRKKIIDEWRHALATGNPMKIETRLRRASGDYRWMLVCAVPLRDESGNIVRWYGIKTDITELKQAEDALRRSEDRIRLIIDTIPIMAWSISPDGTPDFVNKQWKDYTGISKEEQMKNPNQPIHPEDLPHVVKNWEKSLAAGKLVEDEMRVRRADGEYRWFLARTDPLRDDKGNIIKWYGVAIDIEDSKRANEALQKSYEEIRQLTEHLEKIREEERTSIAREI